MSSFGDFLKSGGGFSMFGQSLGGLADMAFSAKEAEKARSHSTKMRNTTYRAGVADARAAGLNPILVARFGGNQAPVANMASGVGFGQSLASAQQADTASAQQEATERKINQEIENLQKQVELTDQQIVNLEAMLGKIDAEIAKLEAEGQAVNLENVTRQIVAEFNEENPNAALLQNYGVDGGGLLNLVGKVFKRGGKGKSTGGRSGRVK